MPEETSSPALSPAAIQRLVDGHRQFLSFLEKRVESRAVAALVETLKPEYRDALRIVDLDDGSLNDLAVKSGISAGNAAVRVHRAREALRKQVSIACGSCAEHGCLDCHCKPQASGGGCQPGKA